MRIFAEISFGIPPGNYLRIFQGFLRKSFQKNLHQLLSNLCQHFDPRSGPYSEPGIFLYLTDITHSYYYVFYAPTPVTTTPILQFFQEFIQEFHWEFLQQFIQGFFHTFLQEILQVFILERIFRNSPRYSSRNFSREYTRNSFGSSNRDITWISSTFRHSSSKTPSVNASIDISLRLCSEMSR